MNHDHDHDPAHEACLSYENRIHELEAALREIADAAGDEGPTA